MEWDARCLDAHAHRGALVFGDDDGEAALAHYATGARLGERSLPEDFDGVLGWGWVDNRPFCAACTASDQRLVPGRARPRRDALLGVRLNPGDNQGACELLGEISAAAAWHP